MTSGKTADTSGVSRALEEGGKIEPGMSLSKLLRTDTISRRFNEVLGKKAPAFASSIMSAVSANQQLQTCDPMSVVAASMIAATLDLAINPSLGFAHIVPYKGKATFQIGWKGIYQLAMRSRQYRTVNVCTVFEGELVKRDRFTGIMEFDEDKRTSDKPIGYLLYFKLLTGFEKLFYMTAEEMKTHGMRYSQSFRKGKGVWVENFEAMAHKTVAKLGLSKYGPLSVEMAQAFEADQAVVGENGPEGFPDNPEGQDAAEPPADPEKPAEGAEESAEKAEEQSKEEEL